MTWNVDGRKKDGSRMDMITLFHETVESVRLWRALAEALMERDRLDRERRHLAAKIEHDRKAAGHEARMDKQNARVDGDMRRKLRNAGEQVKALKDFNCALRGILKEHGLSDLIPAPPPMVDPKRPVEEALVPPGHVLITENKWSENPNAR
jgi:hypothetical protein